MLVQWVIRNSHYLFDKILKNMKQLAHEDILEKKTVHDLGEPGKCEPASLAHEEHCRKKRNCS